jgi:hypothetical protein
VVGSGQGEVRRRGTGLQGGFDLRRLAGPKRVVWGLRWGVPASDADAAVGLVDRLRGGIYQLSAGSKTGAGSAAEGSEARLGSVVTPSGGPRAGAGSVPRGAGECG